MTTRLDALRHEAGFTIIEVMVGAMLLVIGLFGTLALFDTSNKLSVQNKDRVGAVNLARQVAEDIRTLDYDRLDNTDIVGDLATAGVTDQDLTKAGIQQVRGAVTYTVQVLKTDGSGNVTSPCILDSGTDGARIGTDTAYYCTGSANAGSVTPTDGNPDDFRRVEVTVTWPGPQGTATCSGLDNGLGRSCVTQAVLIQNPSGGIGPTIDSITMRSTGLTLGGPQNDVVEDGSSAIFDVVTRSAADDVHWTADDGVSAGTATGSNRTWNFTWSFPSSLRDGAHTITAQAFLLGSGGPARPKVVQINRNEPAPPTFGSNPAGVNTRLSATNPVVEFQWLQNPETDIRGYRVYQATVSTTPPIVPVLSGSTIDTLACKTTPDGVAATTCFTAPLTDTQLTLCNLTPALPCLFTYYVVGVDSRWTTRTNNAALACTSPVAVSVNTIDSSLTAPDRLGCPSASFTVDINAGRNDPRPGSPVNPVPGTTNGLPSLTWSAATPDSGDTIAFYRIYRDPSPTPQYNQRIGKTQDGSTLTFTDPVAQTGTHVYAITAVDSHYNESDPVTVNWP